MALTRPPSAKGVPIALPQKNSPSPNAEKYSPPTPIVREATSVVEHPTRGILSTKHAPPKWLGNRSDDTKVSKAPIAVGSLLKTARRRGAVATITTLRTDADVASAASTIAGLLNSESRIADSFLEDPLQALEYLGFRVEGSARTRIAADQAHRRDAKIDAHRGLARPSGSRSVRFRVSDEVSRITRAPGLVSATKDTKADSPFHILKGAITNLRPQAPALPSPIHAASQADITSLGGWDVAAQFDQSLIETLSSDLFSAIFESYAVWKAGQPGGQSSDPGNFPMGPPAEHAFPNGTALGWFLVFFRVELAFTADVLDPKIATISLDAEAPEQIMFNLGGTATIHVKGSADGPFDPPVTLDFVAHQVGRIEQRAEGRFAGTDLSNYYAAKFYDIDDLTIQPVGASANVSPDSLDATFVRLAVFDYLMKRLPEIPVLFPVGDVPPFRLFDRSDLSVVDASSNKGLTVTYGDPGLPPEPDYFIASTSGSAAPNNFGVGISKPTFQYSAQNTITLPMQVDSKNDPSVKIKFEDVTLRDGFILITGSGTKEHAVWFLDVDFDFEAHVTLSVDSHGVVSAKVDSMDVGLSIWVYAAGVILVALVVGLVSGGVGGVLVATGLISGAAALTTAFVGATAGGFLGLILEVILGVLIGDTAGQQLQQQLNANSTLQQQVSPPNIPGGVISLGLAMKRADINRNGIFLSGEVTVTDTLTGQGF